MAKTPKDQTAQFLLCAQPPVIPTVLPEGLAPEREEAIRVIEKKWMNGTVLHYHFLTTDRWSWSEDQREVVRWAFKTWKDVNIGLKFVEMSELSEAEIRIGALRDNRSWSYVGTDILQNQDLGRTMNFGWDLRTEWGHATALHEIGHTLGLPHEHQNPQSGIVWNEAEVYTRFSGPPNNWKREMIYHNILRKLSLSEIEGSTWDPKSIMHYPFEPGLITAPKPYDKTGIGNNTKLSPSDIEWVRRFYPAGTSPAPISTMQVARLDAAPGQQRDFVFEPSSTRKYTIQTIGASDCKVVIFEERDGEPRYLTAEDDSGTPANATITVRLVKGRRYIVRVRLHYVMSPDGVGLLIH